MEPSNPSRVLVELDTAVYRLSAIKKAAYRLGSRCNVHISLMGSRVSVELIPHSTSDDPGRLAGDFETEVLDQDLRETIAAETEAVRNLLLAQAFSATSLVDPSGETADFHGDPLGITTPDRTKNGDTTQVGS